MSLRALILIAAFGLTAANASGQFRSLLFFEGDVLSLSGTQIYLDFGTPIVGVVPPLIPNAGDIVVIVPPPVDAKTSTSFSLAVAQAINAGFRQRPDTFTGYLAEGRTEPGKDDKENDGTITINSPSVLRGAFASGGSGLPPSTKVTSSTGVAYNPTIRDLSPFLTNAHPGTPNAQFLINGVSTGENELHLVEIPISSTMTLSFDSGSNVNQGVTLLASSEYFPSAIPSSVVPWGGSLDLGHPAPGGIPVSGVSVVVDGINGMVSPFIAPLFRTSLAGRLDVSFTISPGAVGTRLVLQALMSDPPNPPFHLNFTQAAD
ncbi:MAG: hypothetical protein KDB53_08275, partial [Planctomycetes bacterium]|nr:hypothetical protein [Planctomycetota bacterium]